MNYRTRGTIRAGKFLGRQMKKGWTAKEELTQVEGSYGSKIHYYLLLSLQRVL